MKKYLNKSNILTVVIILIIILMQAPTWLDNNGVENKSIDNYSVINISSQKVLTVDKSKKYILFFWATWCAPCKVEMQRYKSSIKAGKIPKAYFWAINPFESVKIVRKFIKKENYPFTFVNDNKRISQALKVRATPTVSFIKKSKVVRQSTGISLIGIFRAEWFY